QRPVRPPRPCGRGSPQVMSRTLDADRLHEFWRLQLLDELRRRRAALDYEPQLDPEGRRRAALAELIASFEDAELEALRELRNTERRRHATVDPRGARVEERFHGGSRRVRREAAA